jgi:hypothetical protein
MTKTLLLIKEKMTKLCYKREDDKKTKKTKTKKTKTASQKKLRKKKKQHTTFAYFVIKTIA